MSTASPSGPGAKTRVPAVTNQSNPGLDEINVDPNQRRVADVDSSCDERPSAFPTAPSYDADVEVLVSTDSLLDTQTFNLDDTQLEFPAKPKSRVRTQPAATIETAVEPILGADGTLALDPPAAGEVYLTAKRVLDIVWSLASLIVLSPVLLIAALLIKLTDGGSVFYPHTRVGEGGNEFTCYKFRSMVVNAEKMKANLAFFNSHDDHRTFKIPDDPRVTWIGRWMRRTSIDELPQLWNVLKGDMSIVGPRPPVVSEVEQYTWDDMQRLTVKPGLTCIWQVSGRSRLPFPEQLKLDLEYIENRSMALDLKLIVLTIPAVLSADGAY